MFVVVTLIVAFALLVTAHVAITYGLAWRPPRWRAAAAFVIAPLAPYWAWRERMKVLEKDQHAFCRDTWQ